MYKYNAKVISVYDGDSIRVNIDMGFSTWILNKPLRLKGINAPEVRGQDRAAGIAARDALRALILGEDIIIHVSKRATHKGKYGRYIADIWCADSRQSVNNWLVQSGYAVRAVY